MSMRKIATAALAASLFSANAYAQVEIQWWHSMQGALGDKVNELANGFNASQKEYKIVPVFKGQYPESMTAAIAAFRAGNEGGRRAFRPEELSRRRGRLLRRHQGQPVVAALQ